MPFCGNCGSQVNGAFCASCGRPVAAGGAAAQPQYASPGTPSAAAGLTDNVAGLLCYVLGFITGIIFLALPPYNQNKFVRFHAFQSIFLSVAWVGVIIAEQILNVVLLSISVTLFALLATVWMIVGLGFLVLWIMLMVKAYNGQKWHLPVIGDLAEKQA